MPVFVRPDILELLLEEKDYLETARYLGYRKNILPTKDVSEKIEEACNLLYKALKPQAVYEKFDLQIIETDSSGENSEQALICFSDVKIKSKDLKINLKNCNCVYLIAATIGPQVDYMIRKYEKTDTVMAAIMQSAGAMFIEKVVENVNLIIKNELEKSGGFCKPRFSPGYGDVSLSIQKDFFRLLPCTKIGLTLMDTLIMAPEKSVTAFIGGSVKA